MLGAQRCLSLLCNGAQGSMPRCRYPGGVLGWVSWFSRHTRRWGWGKVIRGCVLPKVCHSFYANCAALGQGFFLILAESCIVRCYCQMLWLPWSAAFFFFFGCTAIYMQQKKGSLPEILEDSLSWNVYTIYFLLEIGMSFERYVLLTLRVLA